MISRRAPTLLMLCCLGLQGCPTKKPDAGPRPLTQHPVGTGPFSFKKWARNQKIILEANKEYWGGAPGFERLIMVSIAENASRRAQLEAGQAHILDGVRPQDARALSKQPGLKVFHQAGLAMGYLAMNVEKPPFDKPSVRRAVALAIDRPNIAELNFQGFAQPAVNAMPPGLLGYDDQAPAASSPQLEKARALIAESGLELPIKTQLWHMPIPRPYMAEPKNIALIVKENLAAIGIEAELVSWAWPQYLAKTKAGEHPMCLLGWTADVADADNFLYVLLGKDNIGRTNVSRYANQAVNDMLRKAQSTVDEETRAEIYRAAQRQIRKDSPIVPLVYADQLAAYGKDVRGFSLHQTGRKDFEKVTGVGDTVVFARGGDASKLDPALVDDGESIVVCSSVYEGLVRYARDSLDLEPCLATSWSASSDGLEWTFELRKQVRFHDGTPFDADAVVFCFERLLNKDHPHHDKSMQNLGLYEPIKAVTKLGDHKVRFTLSRPVAAFLGNLTIYTAYIVSPSAARGAAAKP